MKDVLTYQNFIGSVHFSAEDEVFFGKIEGIDDLISFEGTTVSELQQAFYEAVEDYIELCREVGKQALKSYKGSFNVRVSPEIHEKAVRKATLQGISLNQFVQKALEKEVV
ncbi:MAG: type II toxin-antitoxin system HicB family antitoxin [bacterium]|nr:type II toxin-antitoxin system HicB family antitoxin [bacterium]